MNDTQTDRPAPPEPAAVESPVVGKIASPPQRESTTEQFWFWIPDTQLIEKTQIVRVDSQVGGRSIRFFGVIGEVFRQSRLRSMGEEIDVFDGDLTYQPPFKSEGVSFARATILRTQPAYLTAPFEQSPVRLANAEEAQIAYGIDEVSEESRLAIGRIKNGGEAVTGAGIIDLDYLLGASGGHMNVNGVAGRGTKSSFLLFVIYMLLHKARERKRQLPSDNSPMSVVPIILNVKGFDLFHIDCPSRGYDPARHAADWAALGIPEPRPFENVRFYAPQLPNSTLAVTTGRTSPVEPYSWGLADIIEGGLLSYMFADSDLDDPNFGVLVRDIEAFLTHEQTGKDGAPERRLRNDPGVPQTFDEMKKWIEEHMESKTPPFKKEHHQATRAKLWRRFLRLLLEGNGVLRRGEARGRPLVLKGTETCDPVVIDLNALGHVPVLQRFVVAALFQQLVEQRTGRNQIEGLRYLIAVDELNRFAPRGARDPVTQLIERVAAEMRSQGIILLGAQQQASKVSDKVIENAGIRVLGRSGSLELSQAVWRGLSDTDRHSAASLDIDEKMILQDSFRAPMHVRVPFPPWAMRKEEAIRGKPAAERRSDGKGNGFTY